MNQVDLIAKKRDGQELNSDELAFLISEYVKDSIPDYQVSAFLMATYFQGMTAKETATLTQLMRDSGTVLDLSAISGFKTDKHSTGGVGDKVSLVLAPLVASAGLIVPMISGRALAHTGGTLDKLEAIPGFRTGLTLREMKQQLEKIGVIMVGQTDDLCPADKKIYALRDATATVNSIPLICASILSKKLAEGIDALVLDVKAGSGAIFETKDKSWELAKKLVDTAQHFDLKTCAILSSMKQPLGNTVGNWLETKEAIETLKGAGPPDLRELTLALSAQMLVQSGIVQTIQSGLSVLNDKLASGDAFEKFLQIVEMQGGDVKIVENSDDYPAAKYSSEIQSDRTGYVSEINSRQIGIISMALGAGRRSVQDQIDYSSGILLRKKVGDRIAAGETLVVAYCNDER
ncbi:MAG: thymidine phosphorylase, partial [bacterium]